MKDSPTRLRCHAHLMPKDLCALLQTLLDAWRPRWRTPGAKLSRSRLLGLRIIIRGRSGQISHLLDRVLLQEVNNNISITML